MLKVAPIFAVVVVVAGLLAAAPSASADKIMFLRVDKKGQSLWVMRPDGSRAHRPGHFFDAADDEPDLTLDGRRLAWNSLTANAILTSTLSGERVRVAWRPSGEGPHYPRWSPSGERIAATQRVKPPSGWPDRAFQQVFVIRPGAGRPRRLRTPVSMAHPDWSPNGRRIVAAGGRSQTVCTPPPGPLLPPFQPTCETTSSSGLWVINVATGAAREILHFDNEFVYGPVWSPNGRTIAFIRPPAPGAASDEVQVWTVRPNGTGLRQLTRMPVGDQRPSWSPSGHRLAITTKTNDIATIRADGSGLRVLTRSGANINPDWSR